MATFVWFGVLGFLTAFTNGVLGAGGAILFIPLALYALPLVGVRLDTHGITALSLVQGIGSFLGGGLTYARRGQVAVEQLWLSGPAVGGGALLGGALSAAAPGRLLVLLYAATISAASVLLLVPPGRERPATLATQVLATALLAGVGALGGAVGIGAGILVIPVLLYVLGKSVRTASGTGLALPLFISGPALVGKALTHQVPWQLVPFVAAGSLAGVLLGSRLTLSVSPTLVRFGLAALAGGLALVVWYRLLHG